MGIITLTTDHGLKDFYVAAIKGAILSVNPTVTIVDISHDVPPYDIMQAAFILKNAYKEFPAGTVHVIGVMPDANAEQVHVAILYDDHYFVGCDNGIFYLIFDKEPQEIVEITLSYESAFFKPVKDLFTKAACHLSIGGSMALLGKPKSGLLERSAYRPATNSEVIRGSIIYVDHYGNAITNITESLFREIGKGRKFSILFRSSGYDITRICKSYNEVTPGEKLAIFGSGRHLEIAINAGSASMLLGLNVNDTVRIEFSE